MSTTKPDNFPTEAEHHAPGPREADDDDADDAEEEDDSGERDEREPRPVLEHVLRREAVVAPGRIDRRPQLDERRDARVLERGLDRLLRFRRQELAAESERKEECHYEKQ